MPDHRLPGRLCPLTARCNAIPLGRPAVFWQVSPIFGLFLGETVHSTAGLPNYGRLLPMVAVPVALQGRLPTSWVPSLFGSQRPLEGNRHYALDLRAFNMEGGAYLSEYERLADYRFPMRAESTFIKLL